MAAEESRSELTLPEAQELLRKKSVALLDAPKSKIAGMVLEIQRLRVLCILLSEATTGRPDPNTYKELTLLGKMTSGREEGFETEESAETDAATRTLMTERGVSPASAQRLLRVLESVMAVKHDGPRREPGEVLPGEQPESDDEGDRGRL